MLRSPLAFHSPKLQRASESPLFIQFNKERGWGVGGVALVQKQMSRVFFSVVGGAINL